MRAVSLIPREDKHHRCDRQNHNDEPLGDLLYDDAMIFYEEYFLIDIVATLRFIVYEIRHGNA